GDRNNLRHPRQKVIGEGVVRTPELNPSVVDGQIPLPVLRQVRVISENVLRRVIRDLHRSTDTKRWLAFVRVPVRSRGAEVEIVSLQLHGVVAITVPNLQV